MNCLGCNQVLKEFVEIVTEMRDLGEDVTDAFQIDKHCDECDVHYTFGAHLCGEEDELKDLFE